MASSQELLVLELHRCYHCGVESSNNSFKYFDNKKRDQPRFQCHHCHKFYTVGLHGRPQGKTYAKKRNEDPVELKGLSRQCRHCGVVDNALFKYYNNNSLFQPRFQCLSCGKQFQMRLLETATERRLVHTSQLRSAPRHRKQKQGVPAEPLPKTSNNLEDGTYQPFDGAFLPMPCDPSMPLESNVGLLPEMSGEDLQYANFLETELAEEENYEANFTSWTGIGDLDSELLPPLSEEDAQLLDSLEVDTLTEPENNYNETSNDDAFASTANVNNALSSAWSDEDASELIGYMEAGVRDNINEALYADMSIFENMVEMQMCESTSNNQFNETLVLERSPGAAICFEPLPSWTQIDDTSVDSYNMSNYADAAAACYPQFDMDMAVESNFMEAAPSWTF